MPKEPASFSSGDKPQHDSSSDQHTMGSISSQAAPSPKLPSSRKSWNSSFEDMPAYPSLSAEHKGISDKKNTTLENLPELPLLPSIASHVSRSLVDQDDHPAGALAATLPPIPLKSSPSESPPIRLATTGKNNHSWEPQITPPASKENDTATSESLDVTPPTSPPLAEENSPEVVDTTPPIEQPPSTAKSPLIRAGLLDKIKSNRQDHSPTAGDSPFRAISSETSAPTESPRANAEQTSESSTSNNSAGNTSTPFAETQQTGAETHQRAKYTDQDLQDALRPLIDSSNEPIFNFSSNNNSYLEPMLRSTVRRAIAEQMVDASPFRDVPGWNKLAWKLRALMSSRTYDDILFDQTRRYQVEEVFLLRPQTRSLISYASNNPARHAKASKVEGTVKKIATKTAATNNNQASILDWEENRQLVIRPGKHSMLAAIVHGSANHVLEADLDYLLSQVEERLGKSLEDSHQAHLQILQPMLECCLLIQSLSTSN